MTENIGHNNEQKTLNEELGLIDWFLSPDEQKALQDFSLTDYAQFQTEHKTDFPERSHSLIQQIENSWWILPESLQNNSEEIGVLQLYMKLHYGHLQDVKYQNIKIDWNAESLFKILNIKEYISDYLKSEEDLNNLTLEKYNSLEWVESVKIAWSAILSWIENWDSINNLLPNKESVKQFQLFLKMNKLSINSKVITDYKDSRRPEQWSIDIDWNIKSVEIHLNNLEKKRATTNELANKYFQYLDSLNQSKSNMFSANSGPIWSLISQWKKQLQLLNSSNLFHSKDTDIDMFIDRIFVDVNNRYNNFYDGMKYIQNRKVDNNYTNELRNLLKRGNFSNDASIKRIWKEFDTLIAKQDKNDLTSSWWKPNTTESWDMLMSQSIDNIIEENTTEEQTKDNPEWYNALAMSLNAKKFILEIDKEEIINNFIDSTKLSKEWTVDLLWDYIPWVDSLEEKSARTLKDDLNLWTTEYLEELATSIINMKKEKENFKSKNKKDLEKKKVTLKNNEEQLSPQWKQQLIELQEVLGDDDLLDKTVDEIYNNALSSTIMVSIKKAITYDVLNSHSSITNKAKEWSYTQRVSNFSWAWSAFSEDSIKMFYEFWIWIVWWIWLWLAIRAVRWAALISSAVSKQWVVKAWATFISKEASWVKQVAAKISKEWLIKTSSTYAKSELVGVASTISEAWKWLKRFWKLLNKSPSELKTLYKSRYISTNKVLEEIAESWLDEKSKLALKNKLTKINNDFAKLRRNEYDEYYKNKYKKPTEINGQITPEYEKWWKKLSNENKDKIVRETPVLQKQRIDMNQELANALEEAWVSTINMKKIIANSKKVLANDQLIENNAKKAVKKAVKKLDQWWLINKSDPLSGNKKIKQINQNEKNTENWSRNLNSVKNIQKKAANDSFNPDTVKNAVWRN